MHPSITTGSFNEKCIIVRADLDVDLAVGELSPSVLLRLEVLKPTIDFLKSKGAKRIILIGHMGRPTPETKNKLTLKILIPTLNKILNDNINFIEDFSAALPENGIVLFENLRFWEEEEKNDIKFAEKLAGMGDIYINESFATSHRSHASIVTLPTIVRQKNGQAFLGLRFEEELKNLNLLIENPQRPFIAVISGTKEDKIKYSNDLMSICDKVLVGGRLPDIIAPDKSIRLYTSEDKLIIGNLLPDKEDLTIHTIDRFKEEISKARTVLLAGVLGKYEDPGHRQATETIFRFIAQTDAYKIVGGGDSLMAIDIFGIQDKFNWVSVGGGAMLEYLVSRTLPGIKALID